MTVGEQQEWIRRHLDRHRVSRRSALKGGVGLAAAFWAASACGRDAIGGGGGVVGRHLSFGPDPTRQMGISGELTGKPAGTVVVDIGRDTGYGQTVEAEVRELVSMVPQGDGSIRAADQFFVHAHATDLAPGETFHYRFRLADGTTTDDAEFTTAPASAQPFTFTAFADHGVGSEPAPDGQMGFGNDYNKDDDRRTHSPADALVALIAAERPAFHLLAGDICYADPTGDGKPVKNNGKGYDNFDPTVWTQYFAAIEPSAATTPWLFTTGNHDMEALYDDNTAGGASHGYAGIEARLDFPGNGPGKCPSVYSVVYGNVGIVSLDANDLSKEIPTNAGYSDGAQVGWLGDRLAKMRADPKIDFIVAFFHHCAYATGRDHASDDGVRSALAPLFDRFTVDLVVQGHNHQYERTDPIRGGGSTKQAPDGSTVDSAADGTTYVCCGSGGRPRNTWQHDEIDRYRGADEQGDTDVDSYVVGDDGEHNDESVGWSQARYRDYAYLTVRVTPAAPGGTATMSVRAVTDGGDEIDRVDIVRKAGGAATATPTAWTRTRSGLSVPGQVGNGLVGI